MNRHYRFYDMEDVVFDDQKSVKELMEYVFEQSDYYEPAGMDIVTVYDASKYYVVTDTSQKCADELNPSGNNGFCVAYLKQGKFFFAEGGWGHHMIEMNAVKLIDNPVDVKVVFDDFRNTVVINGALTLGEIFSFLCMTTYISPREKHFLIGELDFELSGSPTRIYDVLSTEGATALSQAVEGLISPTLVIFNK